MATTAARLQIVVEAETSKAEADLDGVGKKADGLGSKLGGALATGAVAGGVAIAAGLAVGIKAAGDLEQSVANISTIKPEIDNSAVFASLNEMSTRVPQSSKQLGDAMYNVFSSFNTDTAGAMKLVEQFAQGAVGASTDAETFGTSILGVMNAYGSSVDDAAHISDVFFNTVNAGVVSGKELASSLGPVTQSAKAAGVSIDDLGGLIAGVTKEGGPAAQNINNLNNFLQKVTTTEAQKAMGDLGVKVTDATGKFRPTTEVLTDLKAKLGDMTEAGKANALQAIFPDAQARQGAVTLMSQLDFVKGAIEDNKTSAGSAAAAYEKMSATFNSQSQLLMNTMTSILTTVGASLLPAITPVVTAFAKWLPDAFKATSEAVGPVLSTLGQIGAGLASIFNAADDFDRVGALLDNIFPPAVSDAIMLAVTDLGGVFRAVLGGDIPSALQSLQWLLGDFGDILVGLVEDWAGKFAGWVDGASGDLLDNLGDMAVGIQGWVFNTGLAIVEKLATWAAAFIDWVGPKIPDIIRELGGFLAKMLAWAGGTALPTLVEKLGEWGLAFVEWVGPRIPPLLLEVGKLLVELGGWLIGTALPAIVEKLGEWAGAFVSWVGPKIPPLLLELGKLSLEVLGWMTNTALPDLVEHLVEWGGAFLGWVAKDVLPTLPEKLGAILAAVAGWVGQKVGEFGTEAAKLGSAVLTGIKDGAQAMWDGTVKPWFDGTQGLILGAIGWTNGVLSWIGDMTALGKGILGGLMGGVTALWNGDGGEGLKAWFESVGSLAVAAIKGSPLGAPLTWLVGIGGDILQGIQDGISGALAGFWGWLQTNFVDKIPELVRNLLNIHSPSGVFADIGRNIVEGLRVGMEGQLPSIDDVVSRVIGRVGSMNGSVDDWLKTAMQYTGVPDSWLPGLKWIVQHESSGDPTQKNPHSTASGLFQIIDTTWDASRDKSLPDNIFNPVINAIGGIRYIASQYGTPDDAVAYWKEHGHYAQGGWAGLGGPELAWLGEKGPEYVIPNSALRSNMATGSVSGGNTYYITVPVTVGATLGSKREIADAVIAGLNHGIDTGRIPGLVLRR